MPMDDRVGFEQTVGQFSKQANIRPMLNDSDRL
jgi:hypothetical protein